MALAIDSNTPEDVRGLARRGGGGPWNRNILGSLFGGSNSQAAPGPAAGVSPQRVAFNNLYNSVVGGDTAPASPAQDAAPAAATATASPPAQPFRAPPDLPGGVRNTGIGGIYEGKRGFAGERVFSDNPYDSILTDRSAAGGGMVRRSSGDLNAATRVLGDTPGFTDRSGRAPTQVVNQDALATTPHYNQSVALDPSGYNAGSRSGAPMFSREWEQLNQRLPTGAEVDPSGTMTPEQRQQALGAQISANKQALAMSRVQRGVATGAGNGVTSVGATPGSGGVAGPTGIPGGMNPLDFIKTISGAQVAQAGEGREERQQNIDLQKDNEKMSDSFYDKTLENLKAQYPNVPATTLANAASVQAAISLNNAGRDPRTTNRGREGMRLAAQGLANYTNSAMKPAQRVDPAQADLGQFDVQRSGLFDSIMGHPFTAQGPAFVNDPSGRAVNVPRGTPGSSSTATQGYFTGLDPYMKLATGGDVSSLQSLVRDHAARVKAEREAQDRQGAARRGYQY